MIKKIKLILVGWLCLWLAGGFSPVQADAPDGTQLYFPLVLSNSVVRPLPLPAEDEASVRIQVPDGFEIRIFAEGLPGNPRLMAIGPDGWLYTTLPSAGTVVRLPDRNADGLADGVETAASGLSIPHGIEFNAGWLYVAESDRVERLSDTNADGLYETRQLVTDNIPGPGGHSTRTLHFGPDGKLYVSAGSSCNICVESDPRRAAILRFNADGSIPADNPFANDADERKRPLWAWGLRNSVDFLWTPAGDLWADHNGVDGLGDDLPPEEIVIPVTENRSHGWPYCYTPTLGVNTAAEVRDTRLVLPGGFTCAQAVPALFTAPAHSAPLGMAWGASGNFPEEYAASLYVAFHGSWNTSGSSNRDCKVERVRLVNGEPVGSEDFANGWRAPGGKCDDAATWGRPADVAFGPDGAMYISDDKSARVYRVIYQP